MQPASFSSRFAAMNLDMLIFTAIFQGVAMLLESNAPELATLGNLSAISFVFMLVYFVYPTKATGQTLGKMLLGLKVVPQKNDSTPVSWGQAILRELFGKLVSTIPLFLGYFWARFNSDGKAWHDMISGTHVVSTVYEEEKTTLQKIQQVMLGVLSIPLGVGLIIMAFLYTSLPLDSIKEKIEASGIQVGALTGSLAGGMHFSEIRRHDENQNFSLGAVDVKFSVSALVYDRTFIIEKLTAEEGHIEVPPDFSWATVFLNLMALGSGDNGVTLGNFKMAKMQLKNIAFENKKKVISQLEEFSVKNLEMADKELRIGEAQFKIPGFTLKTLDFKSAFGRIEVVAATGGLGPEFLPLLKAPVDFHFKGALGKNPKTTKIEGGMTIDKIKFTYDGGKLAITVDKLLLNEMFKTALPLEDLDLKLNAEGANALDLMSSLNIDYAIKVCGNEFKPATEGDKTPSFVRADRQFQFNMMPKPIENLGQVIFAKEATLDQIFLYQLHGKKQIAPHFANHQEMVSDLCYQKPVAALQPPELEKIQPLIAAVDTVASGEGLQALLLKSVPITVSRQPVKEATPVAVATPAAETTPVAVPSPMPSSSPTPLAAASPATVISPTPVPVASPTTTPQAAVTPTPSPAVSPAASAAPKPATPAAATTEQAKAAMSEARTLLRAGKYADAKKLIEGVSLSASTLTPTEQGAFYNLKAWIYLYSSQPSQAAHSFEQAFNARKEITDAEGLLRANEDMKNQAEVTKWSEYIKKTIADHPEQKNHLSPNMQRRFPSPAPVAPASGSASGPSEAAEE